MSRVDLPLADRVMMFAYESVGGARGARSEFDEGIRRAAELAALDVLRQAGLTADDYAITVERKEAAA